MRIYLAGPDVFLPDAREVGAREAALAARFGFEGVFPLDGAAPEPGDWRAIAATCEGMIRGCAAIAANLTPFRGPSADPGTVFELGFARALGLPAFGYSTVAASLRERVPDATRDAGGRWRDPDGLEIEDFGLADNLMLEGAIAASGGVMLRVPHRDDPWRDLAAFEACLSAMRRVLKG
ncbi:MAG: nucleoside 2-deoxyribosyltransferase [Acetobacteraceae bacterium]|nr:nucleoside 2-deoxyribosyltransferase [Acetobacteraceae bacterium]